jgi:hypothetical protein
MRARCGPKRVLLSDAEGRKHVVPDCVDTRARLRRAFRDAAECALRYAVLRGDSHFGCLNIGRVLRVADDARVTARLFQLNDLSADFGARDGLIRLSERCCRSGESNSDRCNTDEPVHDSFLRPEVLSSRSRQVFARLRRLSKVQGFRDLGQTLKR